MSEQTSTWTTRVPMRWADIDSLNHVNNVAYVGYAYEALDEIRAAGETFAAPGNVTTTFLTPMLLSRVPVTVHTEVADGVITQEICSGDAGDVSNARVVTTQAVRELAVPPDDVGARRPLRVRSSDVDRGGHLTVVKLYELFQEARIQMLTDELPVREAGGFVVGTVAIDLHASVPWRVEPYTVQNWITRVGGASMTVESVLSDAGRLLARGTSVLVGFDLASQSSRRFSDDERAAMEALVRS